MAAPTIFSPNRRAAVRQRMVRAQALPGAPRYLLDDMVEDVLERLSFLRHVPRNALVIGDYGRALARELSSNGSAIREAAPEHGLDEEQPLTFAGFDFIASLGTLDTVNDLPGALVHLRNALAPGGLLIASLVGAGSLPVLRGAMLAADGERPAPRLHPMIDVRAGAQLVQRAGFADPVADGRSLKVRFASLDRLVADLRAQGLVNVLARPGPPLTREAAATARRLFGSQTEETFEIVTLTGWKR
ncbi:methyltransferase domain-containing protein [Novosphingobium sp. Gsoil 351]|uniref:methyltransferase domain-containing protein n=1 Tax=Novosphingobium sp. Gsoil 351 TaxID=2675225 RepID=UPI0012B46A77|nr:methyltransferase domain-containing protein [Novosphingobium sp. Gsoil 351]QGN53544.1 methyltransferase domain-containing protein [Novosphingobium sp. Gsoil 351]